MFFQGYPTGGAGGGIFRKVPGPGVTFSCGPSIGGGEWTVFHPHLSHIVSGAT